MDAHRFRSLTADLEEKVAGIGAHADVVGEAGLDGSAPEKGSPTARCTACPTLTSLGQRLSKLGDQLARWHTVYEVRSGNVDVLAGESV